MSDSSKAPEPCPFCSPICRAKTRAFLLRKLFSVTGVIPLAAFTIIHLIGKVPALAGRDAFTLAAERTSSLPLATVFDIAFILIPLLVHAALGLLIVLDASYNVGTYARGRNWMFTFQRVSGVLALGFIAYHLYELRIARLLGNLRTSDQFDTLCADLSGTIWGVPVIALLYVAGVAAVSFHLANGLWGALCSWGFTVSRRAQRLAAIVLGIVGIIVFAIGANVVLYFATGSSYFLPTGPGQHELDDACLRAAAPAAVIPTVAPSPSTSASASATAPPGSVPDPSLTVPPVPPVQESPEPSQPEPSAP